MRIPFNLFENENLIDGLDAKIEYSVPNLNLTDGIYIKIPDVEILSSGALNIRNPFIDFKISDFSFGDLENLNYIILYLIY